MVQAIAGSLVLRPETQKEKNIFSWNRGSQFPHLESSKPTAFTSIMYIFRSIYRHPHETWKAILSSTADRDAL